ncbi:MAG: hypothetical protein ACTSQE_14550 [Candidatus Heimdallarchaeaceae archaeon]
MKSTSLLFLKNERHIPYCGVSVQREGDTANQESKKETVGNISDFQYREINTILY